jgi:hypothetical protein
MTTHWAVRQPTVLTRLEALAAEGSSAKFLVAVPPMGTGQHSADHACNHLSISSYSILLGGPAYDVRMWIATMTFLHNSCVFPPRPILKPGELQAMPSPAKNKSMQMCRRDLPSAFSPCTLQSWVIIVVIAQLYSRRCSGAESNGNGRLLSSRALKCV